MDCSTSGKGKLYTFVLRVFKHTSMSSCRYISTQDVHACLRFSAFSICDYGSNNIITCMSQIFYEGPTLWAKVLAQ
jgi:hypothetical protein